ncbi:MAG: hypothetical protein OXI18_04560 [bacterium]|nr:hypothetical protein [bacterium]
MAPRWVPLVLVAAALALLGFAAAPGAAAAEPGVAAQLSISFGAGEPRLKLGLGAQKERLGAQPSLLRPMVFRPMVQLSARVSTPRRRLEDLRLDGLLIRNWALYADEGEEENGDEGSGGNGSRVVMVLGGVAAGVLILSYVVADDIKDDILDAIPDA